MHYLKYVEKKAQLYDGPWCSAVMLTLGPEMRRAGEAVPVQTYSNGQEMPPVNKKLTTND